MFCSTMVYATKGAPSECLIWGPGQESNSSDPDHNRGYLGSDKAELHTNNTCADPEG